MDRRVEDSKRALRNCQFPGPIAMWGLCYCVCVDGADRDQKTWAAEETVGPWHRGGPQPAMTKRF